VTEATPPFDQLLIFWLSIPYPQSACKIWVLYFQPFRIQCWSVFKIQVFNLLLKILYVYLLFSILNTFPVFVLWLVFKLLFCMYLVFCSLQNQNTFFQILLNNKHVVYDYFDYFGLVIIHTYIIIVRYCVALSICNWFGPLWYWSKPNWQVFRTVATSQVKQCSVAFLNELIGWNDT